MAAVYCALTCVLMLIMMPRLVDPVGMAVMRVEWLAMTLCLAFAQRFTARFSASPDRGRVGVGLHSSIFTFIRVSAQMAWLAVWYPDTYEFNRLFVNLDHVFASCEQALFGCQPALLFSPQFSSPWVSEPLCLGYVSYYPMIGAVAAYYFLKRYERFAYSAFVILASFFLFYVVLIFLPVAGPQFYYEAVGTDQIAAGYFPALGHYFLSHQESLPIPGQGLFHDLVQQAHNAGERPTAAFPSSHVGVSVVLLWLAWEACSLRLFLPLLLLTALMFFATFYIQAHYAIDAIAGLFAGTALYWLLRWVYRLQVFGARR